MRAREPDFLSDFSPRALETSYHEYPSKELVESVVSKFSNHYGKKVEVEYRSITDDEWKVLESRMEIHGEDGYSESQFGVFILRTELDETKHSFERYVVKPFPSLNILDTGPKMYRIPVVN